MQIRICFPFEAECEIIAVHMYDNVCSAPMCGGSDVADRWSIVLVLTWKVHKSTESSIVFSLVSARFFTLVSPMSSIQPIFPAKKIIMWNRFSSIQASFFKSISGLHIVIANRNANLQELRTYYGLDDILVRHALISTWNMFMQAEIISGRLVEIGNRHAVKSDHEQFSSSQKGTSWSTTCTKPDNNHDMCS